ncbi:Vi polysaccharide biosynthesis protein VipA/TviB [Methyloceanibacter superfactus]|uniref:Vi polysaccharide biosynthesis protein VipA/TviB n=1 Tax=Methyloceanibacter superfactus TaxID=1774969 RepID=A0A1E3VVB5_9HYPH|nr:Vi polysaccharide biosynthesis protein VipA/TviB [Methyloceanibacter superfactus]
MPALADIRIGVIGLGYVGLPLAVYLSRYFPVVGFDIDAGRVDELSRGIDRTHEVTDEEFAAVKELSYTADIEDLRDCNFYVVTVPTPVDNAKRPDLSALVSASRGVGQVLSSGDIVVYESTVFPGATEEICVPELEKASGLKFNQDFYAGYSPERINPGDMAHRVPDIIKVTSGSTPEVGDLVNAVYAKVITAGTHRASSIRVAEAAKVIENIQRDVNIALINELAMLFKQMGLETLEVLEAAGTKWNFQPFRPGLVGGHCIGVDPYYLTYKAEQIGFHPQMILAGRRINDGMAAFVANDIIKAMLKRKQSIDGARVLVMGFTFKENVPDTRNTKVVDLVKTLRDFVGELVIYDPMADIELAKHEYGIDITNELPAGPFNAVILAVKHDPIAQLGETGIKALLTPDGLIYDLKGILPRDVSHARI